MRGSFISFEGLDGSGKSTQIRLLSIGLREAGFDCIETREPGGTSLGRLLRSAFLETKETVSPIAELLLFSADRAQHVNMLIKPSLEQGKIVLSDRFADSTIAYQCGGRELKRETVDYLIKIATDGLKPDLTILLDLPVEEALKRKNAENRMDSENAEFYERVRQTYLKIAKEEPERFRVVSATGSVEQINQKLLSIVLDFLRSRYEF
ncbi:MAG: dTMP kinase [Pyrinomonadaceae bacterium]|nr:dTMP kinase [Pyrinomonadaceae bacterium]